MLGSMVTIIMATNSVVGVPAGVDIGWQMSAAIIIVISVVILMPDRRRIDGMVISVMVPTLNRCRVNGISVIRGLALNESTPKIGISLTSGRNCRVIGICITRGVALN